MPLAKLTTLERLLQTTPVQKQGKGKGKGKEHGWSKRITLLCCVMAVESPIQRQRRKSGVRAGELWIATWRISAPAGKSDSLSEPVSCEVKLWESCARDYGGRLRKGDVVILEGELWTELVLTLQMSSLSQQQQWNRRGSSSHPEEGMLRHHLSLSIARFLDTLPCRATMSIVLDRAVRCPLVKDGI